MAARKTRLSFLAAGVPHLWTKYRVPIWDLSVFPKLEGLGLYWGLALSQSRVAVRACDVLALFLCHTPCAGKPRQRIMFGRCHIYQAVLNLYKMAQPGLFSHILMFPSF